MRSAAFIAAGLAPLPSVNPWFYPGALIRKCVYGISNGFHCRPAPCTQSWVAGLWAKNSTWVFLLWFPISGGGAGESKRAPCPCLHTWVWQCAGGEECSFELKAGGSNQTHVLQRMGNPGPWDSGTMAHQHHSAKNDGLQERHPLLMIGETVPATSPRAHSFNQLLPCQSHGSTGLAANDLLSPMVQRSPAQEGTRRGWDTSLAVRSSVEEYAMQPRGT